MYKLIKTEGNARRAEFVTPHGTFQTPAFMNVATGGAIKGGVSALDLKDLKCQVQLCNTYHLHIKYQLEEDLYLDMNISIPQEDLVQKLESYLQNLLPNVMDQLFFLDVVYLPI